MADLEGTGLEVHAWVPEKGANAGKVHVTLSRNKRGYMTNIAIPIELVDEVIHALEEKASELDPQGILRG